MLLDWFLAFVLTQAIEVPIYLRFCLPQPPLRSARIRFAIAFGASALTHPLLWGLLPPLWDAVGWDVVQAAGGHLDDPVAQNVVVTTIAEIVIWIAEASWFRAFGCLRPWLWAFVANSASAGTGVLLHLTIGWP